MKTIKGEVPYETIKGVVRYWSSDSSESCLLEYIYRLIPGNEDLHPSKLSIQILCELFDFSNALLRSWKDDLEIYSAFRLINDMIVIDGKMKNCVAVNIKDADSTLTTLLNLRKAILCELSLYTPVPSDWEFIVNLNISDACKKVYLLVYGFRNKDDVSSLTGVFKTDIMALYNKVNKCALDTIQSLSGPSIMEQSVDFSIYSKVLELISDALFDLEQYNAELSLRKGGSEE